MKRIIVTGGVQIHPRLLVVLKSKGYQFTEILSQPPTNLSGDERKVPIQRELERLRVDSKNTIVVYGGGEDVWWLATVSVVTAMTGREPIILFPVQGGRRGEYTCLKGKDRADLP